MRNILAAVAIALGVIGAGPPKPPGGVGVGDELTFQFKTVDGPTISSEQLRGKIVLIDFWATWCEPCMKRVPQLVQTNQRYSGRGLQVIGLTFDANRNLMVQTTKQQGMVWPEVQEGTAALAKRFGVDGPPLAVLIGTDGKVLFVDRPWAGLDQAIERAFRQHPPQLITPDGLIQARKGLERVEAKLSAGDARGAIRLLARVPAIAKQDADFAAQAADVQAKLESPAMLILDEAQQQLKGGDYVEAARTLKELSDAMAGLPIAAKAKQLLSEVASKPEGRSAIEAAAKEAMAADELDAAQQLQAQKKDELAYARFQAIVKTYPKTAAARQAAEQVRIYEKDPKLVQRSRDAAIATKAKAALKTAENYAHAGRADLARKKYQAVIDEFPGTSYAQAARDAISYLEGQ